MIGSLRGTLLDRGADEILIEVSGIGYRVTTAPTTALALGELGAEVFVWVHHHVREDAEVLYGFPTLQERTCFEALIGAHGVGPALALAILSVHNPTALARAVQDEDIPALCLVPGVGKKTAARLMVELRARLDAIDPVVASLEGNDRVHLNRLGPNGNGGQTDAQADVRAALAELGYTPEEIRAATVELPESSDTAELLRSALATLAARRP